MEGQEVKEGYKLTEVGVVPEDWEVRRIGQISEIYVGKDLKREQFSENYSSDYKYPVYSNTVDIALLPIQSSSPSGVSP
jgi:type I restriction enzyme S subunit